MDLQPSSHLAAKPKPKISKSELIQKLSNNLSEVTIDDSNPEIRGFVGSFVLEDQALSDDMKRVDECLPSSQIYRGCRSI